MLYPIPPSCLAAPLPKATPDQRRRPDPVKFGTAKAPISANPFVWVFNGIKSAFEWFSKSKPGQWFNRLFSKINQFLKAKPKENTPPAPPAPSPAPAPPTVQPAPSSPPSKTATPAVKSKAETPTQSSAPTAPSPPTQLTDPAQNQQQPITAPTKAKPTFVPYSERPLSALEKKRAKFNKFQSRLSQERAVIQQRLAELENMRAAQNQQLAQALRSRTRLWARSSNQVAAERLIPERQTGIRILDAQIAEQRQKLEAVQSKLAQIEAKTPQLEYWIQFRQNLQAVK